MHNGDKKKQKKKKKKKENTVGRKKKEEKKTTHSKQRQPWFKRLERLCAYGEYRASPRSPYILNLYYVRFHLKLLDSMCPVHIVRSS